MEGKNLTGFSTFIQTQTTLAFIAGAVFGASGGVGLGGAGSTSRQPSETDRADPLQDASGGLSGPTVFKP